MGINKHYTLNREGTSQPERFPKALADGYVKIDEKSLIDLVRQSAEYAQLVKYHNNRNVEEGNWQAFFEEIYDYNTKQVKFSSVEELESKASTSPHLALFLAFLRLFGIAQDNLNTLKKRHIDFYYKEILQIKPRPENPDSVSLFFELSKPVQQAMVPAGTLFEAGKDINGKPLLYSTKTDLIVNKAKIENVKGVYKDAGRKAYVIDNMMNTPTDTNSGRKIKFLGVDCEKEVSYGFAIASPMFNLKDGKRIIEITVKGNYNLSSFNAEYTSENGWEKVSDISFGGIINTMEITSKQPPFAAYKEATHLAGFNTGLPLIRLTTKAGFILPDYIRSNPLRSSNITKIAVKVFGTKDFICKSDNGILNHNQNFLPFGSYPVKETGLRIENRNIFNDSLKKFSFNIEWKGPENLSTYYGTYADGLNVMFRNNPNAKKTYFDLEKFNDNQIVLKQAKNDGSSNIMVQLLLKWIKNDGFAETKLKCDMGHSVFSSIYSAVVSSKVTEPNNSHLFPNPPYAPEIRSINLDYETSAEKMNDHVCNFFEIQPFGNVKLKEEGDLVKEIENEGELFIGIGNMHKSSVLSLHFFLGDHTNNPDKKLENNRPAWFYLENNNWKPFEESGIVADSTQCFTRSGIVCLSIPSGAFTPHTIMPDKKAWLKLGFKKDSDVFPTLQNIETQVVDAIFVNRNNDCSHLEKGIQAGTISKPFLPIQGIKSVTQPYPSYGGRGFEDSQSYYTRVSERLRHKDRAWNIWDYERLILENFPEVFKVKCIPNSKQGYPYSPGSVFIVLIPFCNAVPQKDIYNPRVSFALIDAIKSYFKSHCSPFVEVDVGNPIYEPIQVICKLEYTKACSDISYYNNRLNEDLKAFLAPWTNDPANFDFNRTISKSQILYFMEKRPYVDYIEPITVMINGKVVNNDQIIQPVNQNGILTTFSNHYINT